MTLPYAGGQRYQAWQSYRSSSSYSAGPPATPPLALDQHGLRQRLQNTCAKIISAGRTATSAAAALASASKFAAILEERPQTALDRVVVRDAWSDGREDFRQRSQSRNERRKRAPDEQRRCQSAPMPEVSVTDGGAAGASITDSLQGKQAPLEETSLAESGKCSDVASSDGRLKSVSEKIDPARPGTASRLSPWSELSESQEAELRRALAAESPEILAPGASMPPMKKWLQEKIIQIDKHAESRYKASCETSPKGGVSDAEMYTEQFLQQQYPVSVLRGQDEWQHLRDEEKRQRNQEKLSREKGARRDQRYTMASERLKRREREELLQKEAEAKAAAEAGNLATLASPRTSLWDMDPDLAQKTARVLKVLKPKNGLQRRMEMLQKLSKVSKTKQQRGSKVKGWGVVKMLLKQDDSDATNFSLFDTLSLVEQELLKESFFRYAIDNQGRLKGPADIRGALKDVGLFPKTRDEKYAVANAIKNIVEDNIGQTFEEFVMLTRNVREVLMEVHRAQLEDFFEKFSDERGVLTGKHIPELFNDFGIELLEAQDKGKAGNSCGMVFGVGVIAAKEVEEHFSAVTRPSSDGHDPLQIFEEFAKLFQLLLEQIFSARRQEERDIAVKMGVSDTALAEFRLELPDLYKQFTKYDKDNSGFLEKDEIMQVLADRGILPKTKLQIREVEQIIAESKRVALVKQNTLSGLRSSATTASMPITIPVVPSSDSTGSSRFHRASTSAKNDLGAIAETESQKVQFNFSEFLLLIKRVRRLNSEIQDNELATVFNRYDADRSGELDMREVSILLNDVGLQPRSREDQDGIMLLLQEVDEDGSNTFSLDEFKTLVSRIKERKEKVTRQRQLQYGEFLGHNVEQFKQLLNLFFELDEACTGALGPMDIKRLLSRLRKKFTDKDFQRIFANMDQDNSGFLDFPEFLQLMATLERGGDVPSFEEVVKCHM